MMQAVPSRWWWRLAMLSAIGAATTVLADDPAGLAARISDRVQQEMEAQDIVGLSVGMVMDGKVSETLHFGWEDRENQIATSDDTMYRWASISKPLTAVVALQLSSEGKLDLDSDVREYVPEFPRKDWPITSRQLLGHLGGVVHYTNGQVVRTEREYEMEHPFADSILALDDFKESPLICEPGTRYAYTTRGYMLLGAVVQRAGNDTYANLVRGRIIEPLGLETLQPDYQWNAIAHRTPGYRRGLGGSRIRSVDGDVSWKLPGGGWISNVRDLGLFAAGLTGDDLLNETLKRAAFARQPTKDGEMTGYGLGFGLGQLDGMKTIGHSGSQEKTRTNMLIVPDRRCAVVIMCNTEGTDLRKLTVDLLRMIVEAASESDSVELQDAA